MDEIKLTENHLSNNNYLEERKDLASAFRWAERSNLHEAVANHFSLAVNPEGTQFLMNPTMWHFSRIKASDLLFGSPDSITKEQLEDLNILVMEQEE